MDTGIGVGVPDADVMLHADKNRLITNKPAIAKVTGIPERFVFIALHALMYGY
jgi:hypothetical protein